MISHKNVWYHRHNYDITIWHSHISYDIGGYITTVISYLWYHMWYHKSICDIITKTVISHDPRFQMIRVHRPGWPVIQGPARYRHRWYLTLVNRILRELIQWTPWTKSCSRFSAPCPEPSSYILDLQDEFIRSGYGAFTLLLCETASSFAWARCNSTFNWKGPVLPLVILVDLPYWGVLHYLCEQLLLFHG